ncbi:MAG: AmmeMemoRadiSam system protein B [Deltaproteobacteria bacterium]|nr:AmmeMemoRadiSam system protein B [Deltaproteobacteria bacterium]
MKKYRWIALMVVSTMLFACHSPAGSEENEGKSTKNQEAAQVSEKPGQTKALRYVFNATHAGTWYPGDKKGLERLLTKFFDQARPETTAKGRLLALISPHAGYPYSGPTAAFGYKLLKQRGQNVKLVVIIGPSHYESFHGLALPDWDGFRTPLGTVGVATNIVEELEKEPPFKVFDQAFAREHSVEMQVPMLQFALKKFQILPIVAGSLNMEDIQKAAKLLRPLLNRPDVLFVISSDFTHYGPNYGYAPFTDNRPENLKKLADQALSTIKRLDMSAFMEHRQTTGDTICGFFPISVLLAMLPQDTTVVPLHFDTSGRITDNYENSVSYFSIAFFQDTKDAMIQQTKFINKNDEIGLLKLARQTLRDHLAGKPLPDPKSPKFGLAKAKAVFDKHGVFVTLNEEKRLRGCIGSIYPTWPLAEGVVRNTVNAAAHDPRFRPVRSAEESKITIEISVLTVPKEVASYKDVKIGRDGVIIRQTGHSGVYLPQVAPEQGWDIAQTLDHLCIKAGLPMSAWKSPDMRFFTFQAQVFSEEEMGLLK